MEKETPVTRSSRTDANKKRMKVQIYTVAYICTGYIYDPRQRRLLDILNGMTIGTLRTDKEFLSVSEAEMRFPDGREVTAPSTHINKVNILFVKEVEDGQALRPNGEVGDKPYPFYAKSSTAVRLYLQLYILTGQMYCTKRTSVSDVLNSELRFIAMTNVEICPSAGNSESGVGFIAVNKGQILSLEELETP